MKRILVFLAGVALSASLLAAPPAVATVTECSFDAGTATVTVTPLDGSADINRRGEAIAVDGVDCGAATVTNTDTVDVLPSTGDAVTIDLRADGHRTMTGIENLYGSPFDDRLVGDGQANVLDGADGNDTLLGKAGVDQLNGGNGVDRCDPGAPGIGESIVGCET
jgi:hypothetical protein